MNNKLAKLISTVLSVITLLTVVAFVVPQPAQAAEVIESTVNIAVATQHQRGYGYFWDNINDTLTLSGVNINTTDDFGLKLPKTATVILEGDNYIKAARYGISCAGNVVFKGNGSLTIDAGDIGIYITSQDKTQKIRIVSGKYTIKAGKYGVYSEEADFSFVDGSFSITTVAQDSKAILGRCVNLLGGKFNANAPVESSAELVVDHINLSIEASTSAPVSRKLEIKNVKLENIDGEYNGESKIIAKAIKIYAHRSIIFGDSVPGFVDYIVLVLVLSAIVTAISIPALRKKKKAALLYKRLEEEGYDIVR